MSVTINQYKVLQLKGVSIKSPIVGGILLPPKSSVIAAPNQPAISPIIGYDPSKPVLVLKEPIDPTPTTTSGPNSPVPATPQASGIVDLISKNWVWLVAAGALYYAVIE